MKGKRKGPQAQITVDCSGCEDKLDVLAAFARARALTWPWTDRGAKYDLNDAYRDGEDLAAWAIPQVGPPEPEARAIWARYWLDYEPLDHAAEADIESLAGRLWLALLKEIDE